MSNVTARKFISITVGAFLQLCFCGQAFFFNIPLTLTGWVLMKIMPRNVQHYFSITITCALMMSLHTYYELLDINILNLS